MSKLWIVEMWTAERKQWEPTTGASLSRADGRVELRDWKSQNVSDRFRLRPYVRKER